jgi:hypothetical protein
MIAHISGGLSTERNAGDHRQCMNLAIGSMPKLYEHNLKGHYLFNEFPFEHSRTECGIEVTARRRVEVTLVCIVYSSTIH